MSRKCYCGAVLLDNGACRFTCPPEARPSLLFAKARAERKAREAAIAEAQSVGTTPYRGTMSQAVAKLDPVARHTQKQRLRGARKSHAPGARR
jgi:hypothetical protein